MDKNLVTQGEFYTYLQSHPAAMPNDTWHFLGQGTGDAGRGSWDWSAGLDALPKPHVGNETLPVTYIGLDEARAYCKAVGKRLPHDEEWQYAGQVLRRIPPLTMCRHGNSITGFDACDLDVAGRRSHPRHTVGGHGGSPSDGRGDARCWPACLFRRHALPEAAVRCGHPGTGASRQVLARRPQSIWGGRPHRQRLADDGRCVPASRAHSSFVSCWFALSACWPDGLTGGRTQSFRTITRARCAYAAGATIARRARTGTSPARQTC
jgi:hypothetical protein